MYLPIYNDRILLPLVLAPRLFVGFAYRALSSSTQGAYQAKSAPTVHGESGLAMPPPARDSRAFRFDATSVSRNDRDVSHAATGSVYRALILKKQGAACTCQFTVTASYCHCWLIEGQIRDSPAGDPRIDVLY